MLPVVLLLIIKKGMKITIFSIKGISATSIPLKYCAILFENFSVTVLPDANTDLLFFIFFIICCAHDFASLNIFTSISSDMSCISSLLLISDIFSFIETCVSNDVLISSASSFCVIELSE